MSACPPLSSKFTRFRTQTSGRKILHFPGVPFFFQFLFSGCPSSSTRVDTIRLCRAVVYIDTVQSVPRLGRTKRQREIDETDRETKTHTVTHALGSKGGEKNKITKFSFFFSRRKKKTAGRVFSCVRVK